MLLRFASFAGANKALHPLMLPEGVGVDSQNHRPGRGDLRPWRSALTVATVAGGAQTIYRMGRTAPSDTAYWLQWAADVDIARGFIATDTSERTYWTGDGAPKWTDNTMGLGAPPYPDSSGIRLLGVPAPSAAPALSQQVAGAGTDETRAYVTTWVTDRGEESAPSAASAVTCKPGATIRVTRNAALPGGAYGLATWRVYRTVSGGENDYYFVGEYTAATAFADTADAVNLANPLLSESWITPPADLKGIKALWNGIMVGFAGKSLRFSEPFRPYAWPIEYELIVDDDIVALGRWGQQLIVLTIAKPYVVTGSSPDAMSLQLIEFNQACVAKKGVVEFGHGVAWPSPDGLAYIGHGGPRVLTEGLALREDWQALAPTTFVGANLEGAYVASYNPGSGRRSLMLDPTGPTGFYFCEIGFSAAFWDPIADQLYVLDAGAIKKWDAGTALTVSHEFGPRRIERLTCFAFGQVVADTYPVTFNLWAQGTQRLTNYSVAGPRPFRLPSGFRADEWKIRVASTGAVQAVFLSNSSEELHAT